MDEETNNVPLDTLVADTDNIPAQFLDLLPVGVCVCDANGVIKKSNELAARLWGRMPQSGEQFCGAFRYYYPDGKYLPHRETPMAVCLADGLPRKDWDLIMERPDQSQIMVRINIAPIINPQGVITGVVNSYQEISGQEELQKALVLNELKYQQALEESEQKYRALAKVFELKAKEKTSDLKRSEERYHKMIEEVEDYAILLMDRAGVIQNWNKGAERIKGYKDYEIIGQNFRVFYLPEDQENNLPQKLINEASTTGKAVQEGWRVRKDGTRFWGSIVITALHDAANNVIGFSKVTRDLTDKKRAEDRINQYAKELEFQNRELEQFAYIAAHDMKEPLRKIQFYSDYIFENAGTGLPDKVKDYLGRSMQAAARMKSLIDDLLTYSKASSFSQRLETVDLNEILGAVMAANKDSIENYDAMVEADTLPLVEAIPFQLNQLFDNLINNSLKYRHAARTPHIKISSEKVSSEHLIAAPEQRTQYFYKISFKDNGIGFDPTHAEKIFDLFQRLHAQSDYLGSGVGLAICKKIVQNHQGFIQASGKLNEGAVFEVYIPCNR